MSISAMARVVRGPASGGLDVTMQAASGVMSNHRRRGGATREVRAVPALPIQRPRLYGAFAVSAALMTRYGRRQRVGAYRQSPCWEPARHRRACRRANISGTGEDPQAARFRPSAQRALSGRFGGKGDPPPFFVIAAGNDKLGPPVCAIVGKRELAPTRGFSVRAQSGAAQGRARRNPAKAIHDPRCGGRSGGGLVRTRRGGAIEHVNT